MKTQLQELTVAAILLSPITQFSIETNRKMNEEAQKRQMPCTSTNYIQYSACLFSYDFFKQHQITIANGRDEKPQFNIRNKAKIDIL